MSQDFGSCCVCEKHDPTVRNIVCVPWKLPVWLCGKSAGWGCVVCDLPADGATAIICDQCEAKHQGEEGWDWIRFVIGPRRDQRMPINMINQADKHEHDVAKHEATIRFAS